MRFISVQKGKSVCMTRRIEYFITSWVAAENIVNLMFLEELGLIDYEERTERAKRRSFEYKIKFLRDKGLIDLEAYSKLRRLNDLRESTLRGQGRISKALRESETQVILEGIQALLQAFNLFSQNKLKD